MNEYDRVRKEMARLSEQCYSEGLSACPNHSIFQPLKFINLILSMEGVRFVKVRQGKDRK